MENCEHQNKPAEQGLVENGPASIIKDTADITAVCAISSHSGKPLSCYGCSPPDSLLTGKLPLWQQENGSKTCGIRHATTVSLLAHQDNGLQGRTTPQQLLALNRCKRCAPNPICHCQLRTKELLGPQKMQHRLSSRMYKRGPA